MTPCADLQIGPLCFRLESESALFLDYPNWAYSDFVRASTDEHDLTIGMRVLPVRLHRGGIPCPEGEPLFAAGQNWAVWKEKDGGYLFCAGFSGRPRALRACRVDAELRRAELHVDGELSIEPLRYPLDQVLSWGLLAQCGGVLLHAAVVEKDGVALVLAGRSGAGKSTLSALCHRAGWSILNDDRTMVFPRAGQWMAAGTPWHGSGKYARNQEAPLRALCLLVQDRMHAWAELPRQAGLRALLDVTSIPWFEENWSEASLRNLETLMDGIAVRQFRFAPEMDAVEVLSSALKG